MNRQKNNIVKLYDYNVDEVSKIMRESTKGEVEFKKRTNGEKRNLKYNYMRFNYVDINRYKDILLGEILQYIKNNYERKEIEIGYGFDNYVYWRLKGQRSGFRQSEDLIDCVFPLIKGKSETSKFIIDYPNLVGFTESGRFFMKSSVVVGDEDFYYSLVSGLHMKLYKHLKFCLKNYKYFLCDIEVELKDIIESISDKLTGETYSDSKIIGEHLFLEKYSTSDFLNISHKSYKISKKSRYKFRDKNLICVFDEEAEDYRSVPLEGISKIKVWDKTYLLDEDIF